MISKTFLDNSDSAIVSVLMSYSFTNLEILVILELSYQFIMFFAEMFRKMPETVLYALMPNVTGFSLLTTLSIKNI